MKPTLIIECNEDLSAKWEFDFIHNEIIPFDVNVKCIPTSQLESLASYSIEDICNCIFCFSSQLHTFLNILPIVNFLHPKIVILFSDEYGYQNLNDFNSLAQYCNVFLRNYHHSNYTYLPNTVHIPLGYTTGAALQSHIIPASTKRKYYWSFLGEMKSDRSEMLATFSMMMRGRIGSRMSKQDMNEIYLNSVFVPCGRGNSTLDCFRLYEATQCGAIPVVVGPKDEYEQTFYYENNPPWIFAESWRDAYSQCVSLLMNRKQLEDRQIELIEWWRTRIGTIQSKVERTLYS